MVSPGIILVSGQASGGGGSLPPGQQSPITLTNGDAAGMVPGTIAYIISNATAAKALSNGTLAQASVALMCLDTIAPSATGRFVLGGLVAGLSGGTADTLAYCGTTAGVLSATPDLVSGHFNVICGIWLSATQFIFNPQLPLQN